MKKCLFILLFSLTAFAQEFPADWWRMVPREEASNWEILPQDAQPGEVILSKRTELGVFSNFAATPIVLDDLHYASIEGLWQAMKYPDPTLANDPRHAIEGWPHTRSEVMAMTGGQAKAAGSAANALYKKHQLTVISYGGTFFNYVDHAQGSNFHLQILRRALRAKLDQTAGLWDLLEKTQCLRLKPDHVVGDNDPPAYRYYDLFMQLREERVFCSY